VDFIDPARVRAAAIHAKALYPGPVGAYLARRILEFARTGHDEPDGLLWHVVFAINGQADEHQRYNAPRH
jgi:hypothetical protein